MSKISPIFLIRNLTERKILAFSFITYANLTFGCSYRYHVGNQNKESAPIQYQGGVIPNFLLKFMKEGWSHCKPTVCVMMV